MYKKQYKVYNAAFFRITLCFAPYTKYNTKPITIQIINRIHVSNGKAYIM